MSHSLLVAGSFDELEVLDLRNTFCALQQSKAADEATLASAIRATPGRLKRLLIDNGYAGHDVTGAIASRGACLEDLSMPCCAGLSDAGLQAIAATCKNLQKLSVGGFSRCCNQVIPLFSLQICFLYVVEPV